MKKILTTAIVLFYAATQLTSQVNPHALGARFGGNGTLNGAELSYQHGLSSKNRLEFDLGFAASKNHSRSYLAGIYHWVWNLDGGLNWYVGPGASIGNYHDRNYSNYFNIALGGQLGLEYDFSKYNTPLLLSLDIRPMWDFLGDNAGLGWGASFGLRYVWSAAKKK